MQRQILRQAQRNGHLVVPGPKSLIKPLSDVDLHNLKLSRKLKAACITRGSGPPQGMLILEDLRAGWIAETLDDLKRLHDALGTMIAVLERPLG